MKCPCCKKRNVLPDSSHNIRLCAKCVVDLNPDDVGFDRLDERIHDDSLEITRLRKELRDTKEEPCTDES